MRFKNKLLCANLLGLVMIFAIVADLISALHEILIKITKPIIPGRKFSRNHKDRWRLFYLNYKSVI
jgi:hypothetical protein